MTVAIRLSGHLGLSAPDRPLLAHLGRSVNAIDQIDALADHGFRGVQDLFLKLRPPEEQAGMARRMAERGMALSSFGGDPSHWNLPFWSTEDEAGRDAVTASVRASCVLAESFGGAGAVCVAGLDPDRSRRAQRQAMIDNLKRQGEAAARAGLVLLVEPIAPSRIAGLLVDRLDEGVAIVEAVAMPSVRLLFDVGHVAMMGHDVASALSGCRKVIGLIQVADIPERIDIGLGQLDWPAILSAIAEQHYTGLVELEYEPVDPTASGETQMLARLRQILAAGI